MKFELLEGEKIIKRIQPDKKFRFSESEWIKIPFSIVWFFVFSFILFKLITGGFGNEFMFLIFGILGLYILIGRFVRKYIEIQNSEYLITDKRLIMNNTFWRKVKVIGYGEFKSIAVKKYNNEFGCIIFGEPESLLGSRGMNFTEDEYVFENIKDAKQISAIIKELKKEFGEKTPIDTS